MKEETTECQKTARKWVRKGERLRITIDVEVLNVAGRKANLRVIGEPTAECVGEASSADEIREKP